MSEAATRKIQRQVRERMKQIGQGNAEIVANNTVEIDGNFVTTVVYRPVPLEYEIGGRKVTQTQVRAELMVNGGPDGQAGLMVAVDNFHTDPDE